MLPTKALSFRSHLLHLNYRPHPPELQVVLLTPPTVHAKPQPWGMDNGVQRLQKPFAQDFYTPQVGLVLTG